MTGVSKKSLQTWQRRAESIGARLASGVESQSVESASSKGLFGGFISRDYRRLDREWVEVCIEGKKVKDQ